MEPVTPLRHLGGMETVMSILMTVVAVGAGVVFVLAGVFSVVSLLWDDLLESDPESAPVELPRAA